MSTGIWIGSLGGFAVGAWATDQRLVGGTLGAAFGAFLGYLVDQQRSTPSALPKPPPATPVLADCPPPGTRVLTIGDSYPVGFGPQLAKLAQGCGTPYHHHGVVGSSVTQWDRDSWLNPQLEAIQPNVVLVSLGGNDFMRNDPQNVEASIHNLIARVQAAGARLLWVSPPTTPFPDKLDVRGMWQRAIGKDWFDSTQLDIPRVPGDSLGHPTGPGYKQWAAAIWPWMSGNVTQGTA